MDTFNVTIDNLVSCLDHRLDAYKHINSLFGVLFMSDAESDNNIITGAHNLSSSYPDDLNSCLADELIQFRSFISMEPDRSPSKMLKTIIDYGLPSVFPNVYVALKLFLTLPVSNCEGERSFSLMARVKNELRSKMRQRRLNLLSLMAIECDLVRELDFDDVVEEFSRRKSRKTSLS